MASAHRAIGISLVESLWRALGAEIRPVSYSFMISLVSCENTETINLFLKISKGISELKIS